MRTFIAITAFVIVSHVDAGQTIAPLDQTRSADVLIDFEPCDPLSDNASATDFNPFDSDIFRTQECSIGWSGTQASQQSSITPQLVSATGSTFTKTNGGQPGQVEIRAVSHFEYLFAVFEPVPFDLSGTISGGAFGNPEEAITPVAQVQFLALGSPVLFETDLSTPGPFSTTGTLVPGEYLITATTSITINENTVPDLVVGDATYDLALALGGACTDTASCVDLDGDSVRDDNCVWGECVADSCELTDIQFADVGGSFGDCHPDGFVNIHDRTHVLTCFSGTSSCDALNIDAGGAFGDCQQDGFCNVHDANHALNVFSGISTCTCPSGPTPEWAADELLSGNASLMLEVRRTPRSKNRGSVIVDVFVDGPGTVLRSYQLDVVATSSMGIAPRLIDAFIERRSDAAFSDRDSFEASNIATGQILCGLNGNEGVTIGRTVYLASFEYTIPGDTRRHAVFDINFGEGSQTFLVAPDNGEIVVDHVEPAVLRP
jgi:hypothetical protein